jgi:UDP-2,3-diacylglucosamine pyrophosphatase LpxH
MRIATFGDLHLGHTPVLDKFFGEEDRLLRFDDHLSRTHDRIILMGDIYQTDYGAYPGSRSDVLDAILKRYSRIVRRWSTTRHRCLFGNHDLITENSLGNVKQLRLCDDDWNIWLTHGHQFDPFIGGRGSFRYSVTWMMGNLRRLRFGRLANFLEGPFYDWGQRLFKALESAAILALHHGKNNVIVMGHSHQMACLPVGGRGVYVNSGACVPNSMRYVSIDTSTRVVEVRSFSPPNETHVFLRWQESAPSFVRTFIQGSIDPWRRKETPVPLLTP